MSSFGIRRYALVIAAAASLSGCGGLGLAQDERQPPMGAAGTPRTAGVARSWMAPDAKSKDLLYVVNYTTVDVFSYPQNVLEGQLTELSRPVADCADRRGNVYISDYANGAIFEFPHGGTAPIRSFWPPRPGSAPNACAVDPKSGDLAVTFYGTDSGYLGYLAVYPKSTGPAKFYTNPYFFHYGYCAYDDEGNLFVDGTYAKDYGNNAILAELPRGGAALLPLAINYLTGWIAGIQWDGQYLAVGQSVSPWIYRYKISGTNGWYDDATKLAGAYAIAQFIIDGKQAIVTNLYYVDRYVAKWDVLVFSYPAGGETQEILSSGEPITSVALSRQRR